MLATLRQRQHDEEVRLRQIARVLGVDPSQLRRWEKQSTTLEAFHPQRRMNAKALHNGFASQLNQIEEDLLIEYKTHGKT